VTFQTRWRLGLRGSCGVLLSTLSYYHAFRIKNLFSLDFFSLRGRIGVKGRNLWLTSARRLSAIALGAVAFAATAAVMRLVAWRGRDSFALSVG
jgi:hypothetical protein